MGISPKASNQTKHLISFSVKELEHFYLVAGITYAADVLSYIVLIHLLWPSRSVLYLIEGDTPLPQYDLEAAGKYYCTIV